MSFRNLLDTTCNIIKLTSTDDGAGGQTTVNTTVYSGIPCRFQSLAGKAQTAYGKLSPLPDFVVFIEYRSDMKEGYRVVDSSSREYSILHVEDWALEGKYTKLAVTEIARGE